MSVLSFSEHKQESLKEIFQLQPFPIVVSKNVVVSLKKSSRKRVLHIVTVEPRRNLAVTWLLRQPSCWEIKVNSWYLIGRVVNCGMNRSKNLQMTVHSMMILTIQMIKYCKQKRTMTKKAKLVIFYWKFMLFLKAVTLDDDDFGKRQNIFSKQTLLPYKATSSRKNVAWKSKESNLSHSSWAR